MGCGPLNKGAVVVFYVLALIDLLFLHGQSCCCSLLFVVFVLCRLLFQLFIVSLFLFVRSFDLSRISDQVVINRNSLILLSIYYLFFFLAAKEGSPSGCFSQFWCAASFPALISLVCVSECVAWPLVACVYVYVWVCF